jgi:hypothetical protein
MAPASTEVRVSSPEARWTPEVLDVDEPAAPSRAPRLSAWNTVEVARLGDAARAALLSGYAAVLLWVAGSDGVIDERERKAFFRWCGDALAQPGPASALMRPAPEAIVVELGRLRRSAQSPAEALMPALATLRERVPPSLRRAYTDDLREVGRVVAEASGASRWRFWSSKVSAEERRMLEHFDALLRVAED